MWPNTIKTIANAMVVFYFHKPRTLGLDKKEIMQTTPKALLMR